MPDELTPKADPWAVMAQKVMEKQVVASGGMSIRDHGVDLQLLVLAEEVGELVSEWRHLTQRARSDGDVRKLKNEVADVYITLKVLSEMLDIDLDRCVELKLAEIEDRGGL
jgi:NTP pyrophosphatase (non-canonical NTP hydrolase)